MENVFLKLVISELLIAKLLKIKRAESKLWLTVSTVNNLFSALFMSYVESLPQFLWREVLVSSAHQIVVGEELEVGLRYLQALFLHILAGEEIGIRQHVVVYQLADNLVREWETISSLYEA